MTTSPLLWLTSDLHPKLWDFSEALHAVDLHNSAYSGGRIGMELRCCNVIVALSEYLFEWRHVQTTPAIPFRILGGGAKSTVMAYNVFMGSCDLQLPT